MRIHGKKASRFTYKYLTTLPKISESQGLLNVILFRLSAAYWTTWNGEFKKKKKTAIHLSIWKPHADENLTQEILTVAFVSLSICICIL